jgi:hypothetical protein
VKRKNIIKITKEEAMPRVVGEKVKKEKDDKIKQLDNVKNENVVNKKSLNTKKATSKTNSKVGSSKNSKGSRLEKTSNNKTSAKENDRRKSSTVKNKALDKSVVKGKDISESKKISTKEDKKEPKTYLKEYYDLPYRYDETIVTILAQTPKRLFVYWDVSDKDKERYRNAFGEDFFEKTYPVLLVHNEELNYTFEIPINDFANSWYLDIKDSKTKYVVQLGRKFKNIEQAHNVNYEKMQEEHVSLQNDFVYITDSNKLEAPNDHVLFEKLKGQITYRNLKTGDEFNKDISNIISKLEGTYSNAGVQELYKELYGDEFDRGEFSISNPGSGMPTSGMFRK